jgi:cytochrome c oxidase subunit 2
MAQETELKPLSPRRRRLALLSLALLLAAASACAPTPSPAEPYTLFNHSILSPASTEAAQINNLYNFVIAMATAIFVVVEGLLVFAIFRYRNRPPEAALQVHGNTKLEIAWTTAPAIILAVLLGFTLQTMGEVRGVAAGNVVKVKAIGHQWWWEFRYPGVTPEVVTANNLIVPLGATVEVELQSVDVEHGFWAPELFGKVDAVPGYVNRLKFTPTEMVNYYGGQCTQFCGEQHAQMRFQVVVISPADFQTWLAHQQRPAAPISEDMAATAQLFVTRCGACHAVSGTNAGGVIGPNLTHLMTRDFMAGGVLTLTPENLKTWLKDPQAVKPGALMVLSPPLTDQEVNDLTAYLTTLK